MTQPFILIGNGTRRRLVRLSAVQEILSLMALTPVDEVSGNCRGLANLRGEIIPIFDTVSPQAVLSPSRFILVTRLDDNPIGLIVDDVQEVVTIADDQIKVRPIGPGRSMEAAALEGEILTILDPREVLHSAQG